MSSYRSSYRSWNSSLPSYSSSSYYRTRTSSSTPLSSSVSSTPKLSTYRPSYSSTSGTYKASKVSSPPTTSTTSTPSSYSRYSSTKNDDENKSTLSPRQPYTRTLSSLGRDKKEEEDKPKTYTRTLSNLDRDKKDEEEKEKTRTYGRSLTTYSTSQSKTKDEKKETSPKRTPSAVRYGSTKDLSSETKSRLASISTKKEEKGPPITFNTRYKVAPTRGTRSRDPSPSVDNSNSNGAQQSALQRLTAAREKLRDPSPAKGLSAYSRISASRSRDPSPSTTSYDSLTRSTSGKSFSNGTDDSKDRTASRRNSVKTSLTQEIQNLKERIREASPSLSRRPSISLQTHSRDPSPEGKYSISTLRSTGTKSRDPSPVSTTRSTLTRDKSSDLSPSIVPNHARKRDSSPYDKPYTRTSSDLSPITKTSDISISYLTASDARARMTEDMYKERKQQREENWKAREESSRVAAREESARISREMTPKENSFSSRIPQRSPPKEIAPRKDEVRRPEDKSSQDATIMIQVLTITRSTSPNPTATVTSRTSRRIEVAKTVEKVRSRPLIGPETAEIGCQSDRMDDTSRYSRYGTVTRSIYSPTYQSSNYSSSRYSSRFSETENSEISDRNSERSSISLSKSREVSPSQSDISKSSSATKSVSPLKTLETRTRTASTLSPNSASNKDYRKSTLNMGPTDRVRRSTSTSSETNSPTVEETRLQFQQMMTRTEKDAFKTPTTRKSVTPESDSSTESSSDDESQIAPTTPVLSRTEKIQHKVEEAKSFLLRTLGVKKDEPPPNQKHSESEKDDEESFSVEKPSEMSNHVENGVQSEKSWVNGGGEAASENNWYQERPMNFDMLSNCDTSDSKWSWASANEANNSLNDRFKKLERIDSGEKAWWCQSPESQGPSDAERSFKSPEIQLSPAPPIDEVDFTLEKAYQQNELVCEQLSKSPTKSPQPEIPKAEIDFSLETSPLGDRPSPEGLDSNLIDPKSNQEAPLNYSQGFNQKFISRHTNIDELLGGSSIFRQRNPDLEYITPDDVRIHDTYSPPKLVFRDKSGTSPSGYENGAVSKVDEFAANGNVAFTETDEETNTNRPQDKRSDSAVYSNSSISPQSLERVRLIIGKLSTIDDREVCDTLFSLKQFFHDDKDAVEAFVSLGGLDCLVQIGKSSNQNNLNYTLRALGQIMLYVDGMKGVKRHDTLVGWLYTLIESKFRLVVKTALKLLIVFVEYSEANCIILTQAIRTVDKSRGTAPWWNIMRLLKDFDHVDTELLIYATSLINKTLTGIDDQDDFYDEVEFIEQQGMERIVNTFKGKAETDLDLLDQFQIYEATVDAEDSDEFVPNMKRRTSSSFGIRKSRRYSKPAPPPPPPPPPMYSVMPPPVPPLPLNYLIQQHAQNSDNESSSSGAEIAGFPDCKSREVVAGVTPGLRKRRERAERMLRNNQNGEGMQGVTNGFKGDEHGDMKTPLQIDKEVSVKDLAEKLSNLPLSPREEKVNPTGDLSGLISKAKEELEKNRCKAELKSPAIENNPILPVEEKKSEIELHWEELMKNLDRELVSCDLDFTDLANDDDVDVLKPQSINGSAIPPPPPFKVPPPPLGAMPIKNTLADERKEKFSNKTKKTVKLFWREIREDMIFPTAPQTVWDELPEATVDTTKLENLFESRAKDLLTKKQQEQNKNREIIVLDHKRSNAINIAMTKLPPPRVIRTAILKMDSTVMTREGIEKLQNMLPSDEERERIMEAQLLSPELTLGSAEQFLLTLSTITELSARLKLWAFKLDFEVMEKEIANPLMDLKTGIETLKLNRTFKCILSHLLSIGCFLNGQLVKGFQIEYLMKVPEVKDTIHKHSLLHHLCCMVLENEPETTDLYSEIGPLTRASKTDFTELAQNIKYLETECKVSWDRLKLISRHETSPQLKQKMIDFLADCAERIIILDVVHRRVINRYNKFLLWLGIPSHKLSETKPNDFCKILSEFALEYRTTRERLNQQIEKKAQTLNNRRNSKYSMELPKYKTVDSREKPSKAEKKDAELRQLLGTDVTEDVNSAFAFRRRRPDNASSRSSSVTARDDQQRNDDELMETLVKTASKAATPRVATRERKRIRNADRKSFKRSRTREGFAAQRSPSPT